MHHTHEQHRHKNSEWSVDELFDHFEAYLHTKNAEGVKEVLLILNRMACRRSNHQWMVPPNSPGAFLLKEMYFCVDLALMLFHRKQEEVSGSQFKYFVVDRSPQGGRNWLLSKCDSVDADSIPHATEAVSRLVNHAVTEASKQLAVSACPDSLIKELYSLDSLIQRRTCVPSAIGLSHANTAHKAAAFLHSCLLEASPNQFQNILVNTISFTADLGVEIGIPGFRSALADLLRSWRQQFLQELFPDELFDPSAVEPQPQPTFSAAASQKQSDMDVDADVFCLQETGDTSMQPDTDVCFDATLAALSELLQTNSPGSEVVPRTFDLSGSEVATKTLDETSVCHEPEHQLCNEIEVDGDLHIASTVSPDAHQCGAYNDHIKLPPSSQLLWKIWERNPAWQGILLPFAIPIPGMLHIISNLLSDVDSGMTYWANFWEQLDNLNALLSNQSRLEKFRATCINRSHPDAKVAEDMFSKKMEVLYSKRWGSVSTFVTKCRTRFDLLRQFWDEHLYKGNEKQDSNNKHFNPRGLTSTLANPKFFAYCDMLCLIHDIIEQLSGWSEGCQCHPPNMSATSVFQLVVPLESATLGQATTHLDSDTAERHKPHIRSQFLGKLRACPMQGRRAPELAVGTWKIFLRALFSRSIAELAHTHQHKLSRH